MQRIIVTIAGLALFVPLALTSAAWAAPPAAAVAAEPGTAQAGTVTQWKLTMIAGLEAAGIPPPPYTVGTAPGDWQPTPPAFLGPPQAPLFRQFATMTPFALTTPSQFAPPGPPPLASARYAQDLAEVQALGSAVGPSDSSELVLRALGPWP
jgi:hypothetical protein